MSRGREGAGKPSTFLPKMPQQASTTITIPSTHKMINYNLKQHSYSFETRRKRQAPKYMNEQVFISLLFPSLPLFFLSHSPFPAAARSQIHFSKSHGKMQKQKHNTIYNDIMYFPPASTHNTTPWVAKQNTQKYHTFISPSLSRPFLSLLNLTPSPIVSFGEFPNRGIRRGS